MAEVNAPLELTDGDRQAVGKLTLAMKIVAGSARSMGIEIVD